MEKAYKKMKKGQILELEITDIAFGGKGITKVDGFTIFTDQTVPGDQVRARITKMKKRYAEAKAMELLRPSADRVEPVCRFSGYCGGCKWQFLNYGKQLEYKTRHVAESLSHIGKVDNTLVHPAIPSDPIFGYRNKMEFSCSEKRWLLPSEMEREDIEQDFALGLHVPGTFYKVLDIDTCHLQPPLGNLILDDIRNYMKESHAPVYGLRSHEGFWRFAMLRHSFHSGTWMVNIITASEDIRITEPLADLLMRKYPQIVSVVNNITARKAGVATGEYEVLLKGEKFLKDGMGPYVFEISANSFFQTNTRSAALLYDKVKEYAGLTGTEHVLDLYSGTGTIPIWLSDSAKQITGLEIVESAVLDAQKNCRNNGIDNCTFLLGDIKDLLSGIVEKPDVMIIDPPRVGMHKDVVSQVLELAPEKIVYVSCNPATLARDLNMIKDVYEVLEVQPVDMFPHTYHIESVARLERKK
ncbi:MAG: 23S rRNA (uracil(1939)-C(5))-methyltransferase RlmD [Pseudomonadota bacterium]